MTDEELRVRAIQELEFYKKDDTFMLADITVDLAIKALKQMPVTTTAGEGGVIYYPQVEGVTPTVVDAGKQEPCDNCKYLDGDGCRLVFEQAEYGEASDECPNDNNVSTKNTVSRETFEQVMWERDIAISQLKELGYGFGEKIEPCDDAISRKIISAFLSGLISDDDERKKALQYINELPSVNPQPKYCDRNICVSNEYNGVGCDECEVTKSQEPKTGHWIYKQYGGYPECGNWHCSECDEIDNRTSAHCPNCGAKMIDPQERSDKE